MPRWVPRYGRCTRRPWRRRYRPTCSIYWESLTDAAVQSGIAKAVRTLRSNRMAQSEPPDFPVGGNQPLAWAALGRFTTGGKLVLILSAALLPLALIAIFATLQTTRVVDAEARARLRVASNESARAIAIELIGDMTALRSATRVLQADPADSPSCARLQGVFAQQAATGSLFVVRDRLGKILCGTSLSHQTALLPHGQQIAAAVLPGLGLELAIVERGASARAFFSLPSLVALGKPSSRATEYSSALIDGDHGLTLETIADTGPLSRMETMLTDLRIDHLALRTSVRSAPISSSLVVAMLLPLLMWVAAVGIGWFVVDRLLIRPLRALRADVAAYQPGELLDGAVLSALPAQELRELGETFRSISRTVAEHEAGLAEGLVRQTKLTREVHHRVKNNLQVISSLINFHARSARTVEATAAYAAIQRRVDALAVVHRNHFAEMEENRGLNLRAMIGELAANIRATAPEGSLGLGITLDIDPYLVNQDVAVAVAFLITEGVEMAMTCDAAAQVRIAVKQGDGDGRAILRIVSRALIDSDALQALSARYGRVMQGLARQLRAPLHHDPLAGAYEIAIAVLGRD